MVVAACPRPVALDQDQTCIVPDLALPQDHQVVRPLLEEVVADIAVVLVVPTHQDHGRDRQLPDEEEVVADMKIMMVGVEAQAAAAAIAMAIEVDLAAGDEGEDRQAIFHCMIRSRRRSKEGGLVASVERFSSRVSRPPFLEKMTS